MILAAVQEQAMSEQEQPLSDQATQCRRLAHVLTLTKQMLAHADKGEWERVTELELERRDDLSTCFAESTSHADSVLVAEAIAALLHLNEELMAKLKTARNVVMKQGIEYSRNLNAVGNYQTIEIERS